MKLLFLSLLFVSSFSFGQVDQLNKLIDNWHLAATNADLQKYSQIMSDKFVFLGTAPGERWDKNAFLNFSKPYFDKGKAWDFKPSNRYWEFNSDSTVAWFDENLDTWMRGCRGSGILQKENNSWKISYYNLTVLIENEKIGPFIKLRDQK